MTAVAIDDFSSETIGALVDRIRASRAEEDFVYREAELDDLWRILDTAVLSADREGLPASEIEHLKAMLALVRQAHDLVGHGHPDANPKQAADLLDAGV